MTNGQGGCVISGVKLRKGCFVDGQRPRKCKTKNQKKPCWQPKKKQHTHEEEVVWLYTHIHVNSRLCVRSHLTHSIMLHTSIAFTYSSFFPLTCVSTQFTLYELCLMSCINKRLYRPLYNFKYDENSQSHHIISYNAFIYEFKRYWWADFVTFGQSRKTAFMLC